MRLWRLYDHTTSWARDPNFDPLAGTGGLFSASRWNNLGTAAVYLSSSPSLTILETLVHVNPAEFAERRLLEVEIKNPSVEAVSEALFIQLLRDALPHQPEALTREFGSRWAQEGRSLLLEIPSIVVPVEKNYLLNPRLVAPRQLQIVRRELVRLDRRIFHE